MSFVGSLRVLLLLIFLSGRIVRPFLENYEKQKQFITDARHELKTPLTILNADAEILAMDYRENEWGSDIQTQTKRLADLTNDLILLSRMEEEQTRLQMLELPLSDIAEETVAPFQAVAAHRTRRWNCTFSRCSRCAGRMQLDRFDRSTIRNIYYDIDTFRLIRRSLEKPTYKEKLHIRSCRQVRPEDPVLVELKKKFQSVAYKRRLVLPEEQAMTSFRTSAALP